MHELGGQNTCLETFIYKIHILFNILTLIDQISDKNGSGLTYTLTYRALNQVIQISSIYLYLLVNGLRGSQWAQQLG